MGPIGTLDVAEFGPDFVKGLYDGSGHPGAESYRQRIKERSRSVDEGDQAHGTTFVSQATEIMPAHTHSPRYLMPAQHFGGYTRSSEPR